MKSALRLYAPYFLFFTLLTWWVSSNAFFWDTLLQASKQAHFFFEYSFSSLILPLELDAGHPPFFALYLAFIWTLFGKSLVVSHWAMLPFLLGIVWQFYRLLSFFFARKQVFWVMLVICTNVTFLGQSSLVSPDIAILFFFILAVNGIFYQKRWQIIFGTIGMSLLSIRAIVLIAALLTFQIYVFWLKREKIFSKEKLGYLISSFLPVVIVAGTYYLYHYAQTGWLLSTPNEAWTAHREVVSISGLLKKTVVLGWRLTDYGLIAVWMVFAGMAFWFLKEKKAIDLNLKQLFALPVIVLLAFLPLFLFLNNPIAHRYLMPVMLSFTIAVCYLIFVFIKKRNWQIFAITFIVLTQISGNFWVYPRHIAQGWDSTLAHLPYYQLRKKMINYLDKEGISLNETGTEFPMIGPAKYLDLSERDSGFKEKDMEKDTYIVYSTVFNDFSDEALVKLETDFEIVKTFVKGQIEMTLYKKRQRIEN